MFYINGTITQATLKRLVRYMHTEATNTDLYVYINSPGGCTRSALAMFEILRSFADKTGARVITQALDECYSAALVLYLAGDERYATEHATFMIHEVSVEEGRDKRAKGYKQTATELEKETKILFNVIKKRSKLSLDTIRKKIQKAPEGDWLFEVDEAVRSGIVTGKGFYLPDPREEEPEEEEFVILDCGAEDDDSADLDEVDEDDIEEDEDDDGEEE